MRSLMELQFPRMVHGPSGASQRVDSRADCAEALASGWCLTPVLTPEQREAVFLAHVAAGEVDASAEPFLEPVDSPETPYGRSLRLGELPAELEGEPVAVGEFGPMIGQKKRGRPRKV